MTTSAPERVWSRPNDSSLRRLALKPSTRSGYAEYIRADIAEAALREEIAGELEAEADKYDAEAGDAPYWATDHRLVAAFIRKGLRARNKGDET